MPLDDGPSNAVLLEKITHVHESITGNGGIIEHLKTLNDKVATHEKNLNVYYNYFL